MYLVKFTADRLEIQQFKTFAKTCAVAGALIALFDWANGFTPTDDYITRELWQAKGDNYVVSFDQGDSAQAFDSHLPSNYGRQMATSSSSSSSS